MLRFGKKIALPSTAQIKHELRLMSAADTLEAALGRSSDGALTPLQIGDIAAQNGISAEGQRMLVDRLAHRS